MMLFSGLLIGCMVCLSASPVIGEMVATLSPISLKYPKSYSHLKYEDVYFQTSDGVLLRGWFFPAGDPSAPAVLYAPAAAKDQRQGLSLVAPLQQAGFNVLLFSYRGSGSSSGNRFNFSYGARESLDVDAAVRYLAEERRIQQIGAIGHSTGAVSIILSAARNPRISALVAAAPFTSLNDIWQTNRPKAFPKPLFDLTLKLFELRKGFSRQEVHPLDVVGKISPRPILFVSGQADQRITTAQAYRLYLAAGNPKRILWLPSATHAQVRTPGLDSLAQQIILFFKTSLQGMTASS